MVQVKTALLAALTAIMIGLINWVVDPRFLTGFFSGWSLSSLFN